ncbi:uncharacterized protein N7443_001904 [Penicillium atrosanguineum]|uniref:LisH domain-containing protein n=1 Tax=Penicillium atrosanguineum TaxID=1132637 RepID=A0A9W9PY35_9EURO|nr:uncharacterized protein N7443_001904 [Penicillium atrosanguineum]KAJ5309443.1 hypothetical protein N7443_001904 [Penicillium atrosanguineum]KAJ5314962.1 hypothetical protein N7476_005269 [Penicillium atrosanguineum]
MVSSTAIDALTSALVARFLRANNYSESLQAFIREAGLPVDAGQASGDDTNHWTIQGLLEEKKTFDHTANFERYGKGNKETDSWSVPAPSKATIVNTPTSSNLLAASVDSWHLPEDDAEAATAAPVIISTGADRQVHLSKTTKNHGSITSFSSVSDSPVLSYVSILKGRYVLMTNMSGGLILLHGSRIVDSRKDHSKYAVKVVAYDEKGETDSSSQFWVATAGWDATVYLYCVNVPNGEDAPVIGEPVAHIKLTTNPESLVFVRHIDTNDLILLVSRRDSTHIYYYQVASSPKEASNLDQNESDIPSCRLLGQQNLAPHSNAWIGFSPAHMALSPHDPGLLAVATSTLPHMKMIIVRLLFPSVAPLATRDPSEDAPVTQASQALESLALQNREDAAILIQANTFAPQTAYSTPQVAWRPDGSGVWVNGDDGMVRGIETKTGKVVATLKNGHEPGCKVRTIWAGYVDVQSEGEETTQEEWVVSGGFDKRLILWKV